MATTRTRYVNTASTAGGDGTTNNTSGATRAYATLNDCITAQAADLVSADVVLDIICEGTAADTAGVDIIGYTTDATRYINIRTTQANRHDGKWNTSKYRLECTDGCIAVEADHVRIDGLQIKTNSASGYPYTVGIFTVGSSNDIRISNCIHWGNYTDGNATRAINVEDSQAIVKIWNNVIYFTDNSGYPRGIDNNLSAAVYAYNNTIVGSYVGIYNEGGAAVIAKNNLVSGSSNSNYGGVFNAASTNNASDDGTSSGAGTDRVSQTFTFVNAGSRDYHLSASDTGAKGYGANLSGDANIPFSTDIDGASRDVPWDIGADEIVTSADTTAPTQPTNFSISSPTSSSLTASWTASTDAVGVSGYIIDVATASGFGAYTGSYHDYPVGNNTSYVISGLGNSTQYFSRLRAQDNAGNISSYSAIASGTTLGVDVTAPSVPSGLAWGSIGANQMTLSWNNNPEPDLSGYLVDVSTSNSVFIPVASYSGYPVNTNSLVVGSLSASTNYYGRVRSMDYTGNKSNLTSFLLGTTIAPSTGYYISSTGDDATGDGSYGNPWRTSTHAFSVGGGSKTYTWKNGTYNYAGCEIVNPPSGTSGTYTICKAESDGGVIITGVAEPVTIAGRSYIQVEGFTIKNATGSHAIHTESSDHLKFKRIGVKNGAPWSAQYANIIELTDGTTYSLVEDCWIAGSMRYGFLSYATQGTTTQYNIFRRCVVRFDGSNSPEPHAGFSNYGSTTGIEGSKDVIMQNCIALDFNNADNSTGEGIYGGFYNPHSMVRTNNYGSIALNIPTNGFMLTEDSSSTGNNIDNCVAWDIGQVGIFLRDGTGSASTINQCTVGEATGDGLGDYGSASANVTNSIFYNVGGMSSDTYNYNLFFGVSTPGGATNSLTSNPLMDHPVRIETDSPAYQSGSGGVNRGATIIYKHGVDGTLWGETGYNQITTNRLWPYPYESRIRDLFREADSGTWATNMPSNNETRGFCANGQTLTDYIWGYLGNSTPSDIYGSDTTPPTQPTGNYIDTPTGTTLTAHWNASTDDTGVSGYYIDVATASGFGSYVGVYHDYDIGNVTSYIISGLGNGTTYFSRVRATDAAGNLSEYSQAIASGTTLPDFVAPLITAAGPSGTLAVGTTSTTLTVTTNENATVRYALLPGSGYLEMPYTFDTTGTTSHSHNVSGLTNGSQYAYYIKASDSSGNATTNDTLISFSVAPSGTIPTVFQSGVYGGVNDTWINSYSPTQNYGTVDTMEIYGGEGIKGLIKFDLSSIPSGTVISSATLSLYNHAHAASPSDCTISVNPLLRNWNETQATWNVFSTGNNWGTAGANNTTTDYTTVRQGDLAIDTTAGVWRDIEVGTLVSDWVNGVRPNYGFVLRATPGGKPQFYTSNYATQSLRPKLTIGAGGGDTQKPTVPINVVATTLGSARIDVTWNASTDNIGVTSYKVRRDGVVVYTGSATIFQDSGLTPSTTYGYTVTALDAAANESLQSGEVNATTTAPDVIPPSQPGGLTTVSNNYNSVTFSWTASTDNVGVDYYNVYRNTILIGTSSTTSYTDNTVSASTTYSYTLKAVDFSGNQSSTSSPLSVTTPATPVFTGNIYYISPTGTDGAAGTTGAPWRTFAYAFSHMASGDKLYLKDGTYTSANTGLLTAAGGNSALPPAGTLTNRTYVVAENDFQAILDGGGTNNVFENTSRSYLQFEGIKFKNFPMAGGCNISGAAKYITIKRCGFISATTYTTPGNTSGITIGANTPDDSSNSYILLEDVWVCTKDRYAIIVFNTTKAIFRRVVAKRYGVNTPSSGNPQACFTVYNSSHCVFENCIALEGTDYTTDTDQRGFYIVGNTGGNLLPQAISNKYYGIISLNHQAMGMEFSSAVVASGTIFKDIILWNPGDGYVGVFSGNGTDFPNQFRNALVGGSQTSPGVGIGCYNGADVDIYNTMFLNLLGGATDDQANLKAHYVGRYNTGAYGGTTVDGTQLTSNPGQLYLPRVESNSAYKGQGNDGSDIGANVIYKYGQDGTIYGETGSETLSTSPLWPWPNEAQIKADFTEVAGTTYGWLAGSKSLTTYIWEFLGNSMPTYLDIYGDIGAPDAPTNVQLTNITTNTMRLTWTASGAVDIASYRVDVATDISFTSILGGYNNLNVGNVTFLDISGLSPGTVYYARVRAVDTSSNASVNSSSASASTLYGPDLYAPSAPSGFYTVPVSSSRIDLRWTTSYDNIGVSGYLYDASTSPSFASYVYRDVRPGNVLTASVTGLSEATNYYFRVRASDNIGNTSIYSPVASGQTLDATAPTTPGTLSANTIAGTSFNLAWGASTDNVAVSGYLLDVSTSNSFPTYVSGYQNKKVGNVLSTTVSGLTQGTTYYSRISAMDYSGNESSNSNTVTTTTLDLTAPSTPTNLSTTVIPGTGNINLGWTASTDNVAVSGYYYDIATNPFFSPTVNSDVNVGNVTSASVGGLSDLTMYFFRVRASDPTGNLSSYSATASGYLFDVTPPTTVVHSGYVSGPTSITYGWTTASDVNLSGYVLDASFSPSFSSYIAGFQGRHLGNITSISFGPGLAQGFTYYSRIRAIDYTGNQGTNSNVVSLPLPDTVAPSVPGSFAVSNVTSTSAVLTWTASTDNVGVYSYYVDVSEMSDFSSLVSGYDDLAVGTSLSKSITDLTPNTTYYARVKARDIAGNTSNVSSTVTWETTTDISAPTAPTLIVETVSSSTFTLSWNIPPDNIGVTSYRLDVSLDIDFSGYIEGFDNVNIGNVTTYTFAALPETVYYARIRAVDNVGNVSASSNLIQAITVASEPSLPFVLKRLNLRRITTASDRYYNITVNHDDIGTYSAYAEYGITGQPGTIKNLYNGDDSEFAHLAAQRAMNKKIAEGYYVQSGGL